MEYQIAHINKPVIQRQSNLTIGEPDDQYEKEADKVADQVMRMSTNAPPIQPKRNNWLAIQRMCTKCEEESNIQRKVNASIPSIQPDFEKQLNSSKGRGQNLSQGTRTFMESRMGSDFGKVRVHTGDQAEKMSKSISAKAFTHGRHIYFNRGQFAPESTSGRHLLAHELTHVMQQDGAGSMINKSSGEDEDAAPAMLQQESAVPSSEDVFVCSKELDRSPIGVHAFFRLGSTSPGEPTFSLQPAAVLNDCWQGIPIRNSSSDVNATADCVPLSGVTASQIEAQHNVYPVGHYCTLGPNSNSYTGVILSSLGLPTSTAPGNTIGIDESAPPATTFAMDRESTMWGCSGRTFTCAQYQIIGTIDETDLFIISFGGTTITAAMNILVEPTCSIRPATSGRYGHHTEVEVVPANSAARTLFGSSDPKWVPMPVLTCTNNGGVTTPRM